MPAIEIKRFGGLGLVKARAKKCGEVAGRLYAMGSKRLTAEGGPEEEEKSARGGPLVKDVAAIPVTRVRGIRFCFREMANRAVEFTPCDYFAARS